MIARINRIIHAMNLFALIATLTTMGMESNYPQLQLKNQKNETTTIYEEFFILKDALYMCPTSTLTKEEEKTQFIQLSQQTEPFVTLKSNNNTSHYKEIYLPARHFYGCNTNSLISATTTNSNINIQCVKTPSQSTNRYGEPTICYPISFKQTFTEAMTKFYYKPCYLPRDLQTLINTGVISKKLKLAKHSLDDSDDDSDDEAIKYIHGPNGCPNEKSFRKTTLVQHTKPYENMHNLTSGRQLNGNNKPIKTTLTRYTPQETRALYNRLEQLTLTNK